VRFKQIWFGLAFILLVSMGSYTWMRLDPVRQAAQDFALRQPQVQTEVGQVTSTQTIRRRGVSASDTGPGYREYDLLIHGTRATKHVVVRVTGPETNQPRFEIRGVN